MRSRGESLQTCRTQNTPGYQVLVSIFPFGGNDANNMIVPLAAARGGGKRTGASAADQPTADLQPKKAAMIFNVGTLVRPTAKATLNTTSLPRNFYSHSDQTVQWQTANPLAAGGTGWGGRIVDLRTPANAETFPMGVSVNGSAP